MKNIAYICIAFIFIVIYSLVYTVSEVEQVVLVKFGKVIGTEKAPGLHFKMPIITTAESFTDRILDWDGEKGQMPTLDKKYIYVDTFARWRIADLEKYYTTVGNRDAALRRLDNVIEAATRNVIQQNTLADVVRSTNRELSEAGEFSKVTIGRGGIIEKIFASAKVKASEFGIELIKFNIKRVNYIESVRSDVYNRMSAERMSKAAETISEGESEYAKIMGDKEKELNRIQSTAEMEAQKIRGAAKATATKIYADVYSVDPEFYNFLQQMTVYRSSANEDTQLYLSTKGPLWNAVKGL
ncbi:protease modulator HflC [Candidatus Pacearchaeota archaeon]|nr:protease modulator HflC [Candidatus Pacearchaeota archaeon]